ncbi:hypothetical protein AMTRI_Chr05g62310 [Amborella trichopoda]
MIAQLKASMPITFRDNDLPPNFNRYHNRVLYITVYATRHGIHRVLIDNGASLNICPVRTIERLCIDLALLKPSQLSIMSYDEGKRQAEGIISLALTIGPISQIVKFYVSYIDPSFNLLLGRPSLHENLAIASKLHQCLKIPMAQGLRFLLTNLKQSFCWNLINYGASIA